MKLLIQIIFFSLLSFHTLSADEASDWLKKENDKILSSYENVNMSDETRFLMIEDTINYNFAGKALGKAVAKQAYNSASEEVRDEYIKLFKRHIALNLTSMMKGYSNQMYAIVDSRYNQKNKTYMIDMEITNDASKIMVTWRVIKHKENFYIIDLYIANISLMQTKRSEFNSTLKTVDNDLHKLNQILKKQNDLNYGKFIN